MVGTVIFGTHIPTIDNIDNASYLFRVLLVFIDHCTPHDYYFVVTYFII